MKLIWAVIPTTRLQAVKEALVEAGVTGMTVSHVEGFGEQKGFTDEYRGMRVEIEFLPRVSVQVVCADEDAERLIQAIQRAAHTGAVGDGKIFLLPVEDAVRIRTGERGSAAI